MDLNTVTQILTLLVCLHDGQIGFCFGGFWNTNFDQLVFVLVDFIGPDGHPCTMVVRTLHWTVPSYWIWGLPFFLFYSTRSSQFLHERPNQSFLKALFCLLSSPMVNTWVFLYMKSLKMFIDTLKLTVYTLIRSKSNKTRTDLVFVS